MTSGCGVCGKPATSRCGRCSQVSYCSKQHQQQHWPEHKAQCLPFTVETDATLGRHLVAARNIKRGETLLQEKPLVTGPMQATEPVCLGCALPVDGSFLCPLCGWPLCGPQCLSLEAHGPECRVSQGRPGRINVTKFGQMNEMYECITPLRCLLLRSTNPSGWGEVGRLQSHLEERVASGAAEYDQRNVIDFIHGYLLHTEGWTPEEARHVCGVLEVNGFEVPAPRFVALYAKASLLEHSCIPNTYRTFGEDLSVCVRAAIDIEKGQHITTSYTDTMWGTSNRRVHLRDTKYFECCCQRCMDPTELGTGFSSLVCPVCKSCTVDPPTSKETSWTCKNCKQSIPERKVVSILQTWGEKMTNLKGNIDESERFLKDCRVFLGENHHYIIDVKVGMIQILGSHFDESATPQKQLQRILELTKDVLHLVEKLNPGLSRLGAILRWHQAVAEFKLYRQKPRKKKQGKDAGHLQDVHTRLMATLARLQQESPLQEDGVLVVQGRQVAAELQCCT